MCGGYYEEEMKDYYGPSMQFKTVAGFQKAVKICKKRLSSEDWWQNKEEGLIHFASVKAEEKFSIAWQKAVAGSQKWK